MTEINKNKIQKPFHPFVIAKAFYNTLINGDENGYVPKEELEHRRALCRTCQYNSRNVEKNKLNALKEAFMDTRTALMGDYCTLCWCNIKEKTISEDQQCAKAEKGERPLWNRLATISSGKAVNLLNLSPRKINIDSTEFEHIIYVDQIATDIQFEVAVETKTIIESVDYVRSNCQCIKTNGFEFSDKYIKIDLKVVYSELPVGVFNKWFYISYKDIQKETHKVGIKIIGKK